MIAQGIVEITLSNGKGIAIVDDDPRVLAVVMSRKWCLERGGYARGRLNGKMRFLHRVVWNAVRGTLPEFLDHINRDRLDNRLANLRPASSSLNHRNVTKYRGDLPLGVSRSWGGFQAQMRVCGATVHLAQCATPGEAGTIYRIAADRLLAIEADRSARGLPFASDEMPPPLRTPARRVWIATWRERLTAPRPAAPTVIDIRSDRPGVTVSTATSATSTAPEPSAPARQRSLFQEAQS